MIRQAFCERAKLDFLSAFASDTYMLALYRESASLDAKTERYTKDGEAAGRGYQPGGKEVQLLASGITAGSAWLQFGGVEWPDSAIQARGALVYNATRDNAAVVVLDFGKVLTSMGGPFTVDMPGSGMEALVRIA